MFISIDGGDGCGKSTQVSLLTEWLRQQNHEVFTCRDPGSTALGEAVRGILLNRHDLEICRMSEMLLFMAARAQMVQESIAPALKSGKIVVSDRFLLSTIVYQGYAGKIAVGDIETIGRIATAGVLPGLGFVLDVSLETAEVRMQSRKMDRMEQMGPDYHEQVRQGFLAHAKTDPQRFVVLDASLPVDVLAVRIREIVAERLQIKSQ
jgi:thymidylate kinase